MRSIRNYMGNGKVPPNLYGKEFTLETDQKPHEVYTRNTWLTLALEFKD